MKPRISCFGHGWSLEMPGITVYCGRFDECIGLLDEAIPDLQRLELRNYCTMNRLGFQEIGSA